MASRRAQVVVVGAGIAGLSAAWQLSEAGVTDVLVLEREALPFAHASGRNAGIFRSLEPRHGELKAALALRTRALLDGLTGARGRWLSADGLLLAAREEGALEPLRQTAGQAQVPVEALRGADLPRRAKVLEGGDCREGLWVPGDGVVDVHAVQTALLGALRGRGVRLELSRAVERLCVRAGRVEGVRLSGGEEVACEAVVVAAGAWAQGLGAAAGSNVSLRPLRRHLALLEHRAVGPTAWRVGEEVYLRPESGGLLASPCDEEPWEPPEPPASAEALAQLGERLSTFAPAAAGSGVRRAWACLRTFTPERLPLAGADAAVPGLFWLGGLGGFGLSAGPALAEVLAAAVVGKAHPLSDAVSPSRAALFGCDTLSRGARELGRG